MAHRSGLNRHVPPLYVQVGDSWNVVKRSRPVSRRQARRALADGVRVCRQWWPDTTLGMLD
ncbi:DUF6233 domain-containing protein [Streptomyces sp. NPDC007971]|uniref:DUF6233 domain-containing protein n=1 Tax=Streptomyces sp. NPDC007971 TaxID=3364799 RepID=UPI0036E03661